MLFFVFLFPFFSLHKQGISVHSVSIFGRAASILLRHPPTLPHSFFFFLRHTQKKIKKYGNSSPVIYIYIFIRNNNNSGSDIPNTHTQFGLQMTPGSNSGGNPPINHSTAGDRAGANEEENPSSSSPAAAAVVAAASPPPAAISSTFPTPFISTSTSDAANYFRLKIHELRAIEKRKSDDYQRIDAQRAELNRRVRHLKEEVSMLLESGSLVADVAKVMGNSQVLVKTAQQGNMVVEVEPHLSITDLTPNTRVALRSGSYAIHYILPTKVDPLVSLMKVEKAGAGSTYDEIGGLSRQVKEIKEVIELPVKHPELFDALGITQPKGVLLYGPPGTGKTLLARAVSHHTSCTFIRVSGAELVQKYIGEGSRMVRELFVMAREHSPSIIFMDEIDSIGASRMDSSSGDSEVQRTMLELLNQLDGFEATQNIKVIMATNRMDILDEALLRPGRIDRKIEFPSPDENARLEILKIHSRKMNLTRNIHLRVIAEKTAGCSGAELKAVCTEAGMFALRERRVHITQEDFELAVSKVMKKDSDKNISLKKMWK